MWWSEGGFQGDKRLRLVLSGITEAVYDGSPALGVGEGATNLDRVLAAVEERARAL